MKIKIKISPIKINALQKYVNNESPNEVLKI